MSYRTERLDEGRGLMHIASDVLTGSELIEAAKHTEAVVRDGAPLRYILTDFTGIEKLSVNATDVRDIARINLATAQMNRDICVAIVAPSDHAFGMARMWEAHVDATGWDTRVFRDAGKARGWLNDRVGGSHAIDKLAFHTLAN